MSVPSEPGEPPLVLFDAVLQPSRSLGRSGFALLMAVFVAAAILLGTLFYLRGAWPVLGFLGLDIVLVWIAFRLSFRAGRIYEAVRLTERELTVRRHEASGRSRSWTFQPYWLRVRLDEPPGDDSQVILSSHGRHLVVGSFLSPDERADFARALVGALRRCRQPDWHDAEPR